MGVPQPVVGPLRLFRHRRIFALCQGRIPGQGHRAQARGSHNRGGQESRPPHPDCPHRVRKQGQPAPLRIGRLPAHRRHERGGSKIRQAPGRAPDAIYL